MIFVQLILEKLNAVGIEVHIVCVSLQQVYLNSITTLAWFLKEMTACSYPINHFLILPTMVSSFAFPK